jgi:amino acid transporter
VFERLRGKDRSREETDRGGVATRTRDRDDGVARERAPVGTGRREVRARQHEQYGGTNWGAAFFGWLVAVGMAALLTALLSAAGGAIGLTEGVSETDARTNVETISLVGGIVLLAILAIAYYSGGYVSGRMSRFDGGRQGLGVWIIGLLVTIVLAILGWVAGSEYNLLNQLNLPRIPVDEGTLTTGAAIALIAVAVGTLLAAMLGGKSGERYHRKIDRYGFAD